LISYAFHQIAAAHAHAKRQRLEGGDKRPWFDLKITRKKQKSTVSSQEKIKKYTKQNQKKMVYKLQNSKNGLQPMPIKCGPVHIAVAQIRGPRSPIPNPQSSILELRCHCRRGLLQMGDARVQRQNGNLFEIYDEKMNTVAFLNILIIHTDRRGIYFLVGCGEKIFGRYHYVQRRPDLTGSQIHSQKIGTSLVHEEP